MPLTFIEEGVFCQLSQEPAFTEEYGHTYREYLQGVVDTSDTIAEEHRTILREIKETTTFLKVLREYDISYTLIKNISLCIEDL